MLSMFSYKWFRLASIVGMWLILGATFQFGRIWHELKPWMFINLFMVLIPTASTLSGLIAIFFGKHYRQIVILRKGLEDDETKMFLELRDGFRRVFRNLIALASISIILLPFSDVLSGYHHLGVSSSILLTIILCALYTLYDVFEFVKRATGVHYKLGLNELFQVKDNQVKR